MFHFLQSSIPGVSKMVDNAFQLNFGIGVLTVFALIVIGGITLMYRTQTKREKETTDLLVKIIQENTHAFIKLQTSLDNFYDYIKTYKYNL